jgi:hypothetical protein
VQALVTVFLILFVFPAILFGQVSHIVSFNASDFSFNQQAGYDVIRGRGLTMSNKIGAPMLPIKSISLIVPPHSDVSSIVVTGTSQKVLGGKFRIYPAQPPVVTSSNTEQVRFVQPDTTIYNSALPYPASPVTVTGMDYFDGATRIVHLQVCPFKYEPANGRLTLLTQVAFTLNFKASKDIPIHVRRRAKIAQDAYDQALRALVDNPEAISAYQQRPDSIYIDDVSSNDISSPNLVQPNSLPSPPPYPYPAPMIIITSPGLSSCFTSFINQKAADGIRAKVITTSQIYYYFPNGDQISSPPINDLAGSIRQYLSDEAYPDGCTWVLLVGDASIVPIRYVPDAVTPGGMVPTDLYYSDFTGNWSPDSLHPELSPSVFVGRLPFTSAQEVQAWTNKVIQYETNPFPGNTSAITRVLWSVSDQMEDWRVTVPDSEEFSHAGFSQFFIEEAPTGSASSPTAPTGSQIISELNKGYGFWCMYHHGSPAHVAVRTCGYNGYPKYGIFSFDSYNSEQYFSETGNGFDNTTNNCTIVYSIACDVAAFDSTATIEGIPTNTVCMAKAWLSVPGGGPAFLGNTREGMVSYSPELERDFLNQIFSGNTRIGQAEAISKSHYGYGSYGVFLAESHNLFGDPSMIMRTSLPSGSVAQSQFLQKKEVSSERMPAIFSLSQNYPNPFNPSTTIRFGLPYDSRVTLKVYDMLGREVLALVDGYLNAGYHEVRFDGTKLSSGVYFYRLTAGGFVSVKKMLMMK